MSIKCQEQTIKTCTDLHGLCPYLYNAHTVNGFSLPASPSTRPPTPSRNGYHFQANILVYSEGR